MSYSVSLVWRFTGRSVRSWACRCLLTRWPHYFTVWRKTGRRSRKHRSASAVKLKQTPAAAQFLWTPLIFHTQQNSLHIENKVTAVAEAQRSQPHLEEDSTWSPQKQQCLFSNRSFESPVRDAVIKTENKINKMEPRASRLINPPAASLPVPFYFLLL